MHQHLTFFVDKGQTLDALEAALAIARRGGLQLAGLQLRSRAHDDAVDLCVHAGQPDLFLARLHNVVGIAAIDVNTPRY
jgi:hypothetical protein